MNGFHWVILRSQSLLRSSQMLNKVNITIFLHKNWTVLFLNRVFLHLKTREFANKWAKLDLWKFADLILTVFLRPDIKDKSEIANYLRKITLMKRVINGKKLYAIFYEFMNKFIFMPKGWMSEIFARLNREPRFYIIWCIKMRYFLSANKLAMHCQSALAQICIKDVPKLNYC